MSIDTSKGWFIVPGHRERGDRSVKEQMRGLEKALLYAKDKTVLDLGCAEGCISIEFAKAGAKEVLGVEVLEYHLEVANKLREGYPNVRFMQSFIETLAEHEATAQWDVVLALAVLHKLRNVDAGLRYVARSARELIVFRWPQWFDPKGYLRSKRNADDEVHVPTVMREYGFKMERALLGPNAEPVQYWRKA